MRQRIRSLVTDVDVSLLVLRVGFGLFMIVNHGWPKLMKWGEKHETFLDPLGVSPPVSLVLTIFGELVCPLFLLLGLGTRIAAVPAVVTMLVAAFFVHDDSPLKEGEHALMFALVFLVVGFLGAGRFSVDGVIARRRAPSP